MFITLFDHQDSSTTSISLNNCFLIYFMFVFPDGECPLFAWPTVNLTTAPAITPTHVTYTCIDGLGFLDPIDSTPIKQFTIFCDCDDFPTTQEGLLARYNLTCVGKV